MTANKLATSVPTIDNMEVQYVPLASLRIDGVNVRHHGRSEVDPILKASIKAHGLRVPLSVRKDGSGYVVFAGGRRLAALQSLAKEDGLPSLDIAVTISTDNDAMARELSLAENFARSEMHEVDEYRAFAALFNDKNNPQTVEDIARRFGIPTRRVEQRLALGSLDEVILAAFQAGDIRADGIRAFTLASNKKAQVAAWAKLKKTGGFVNGYNVKHALGLTDNNAGKFLGLVGEAAYLARGGKVTRDLFGTDHVISDSALMQAMVGEVVAAKVGKLEKEGWKFATSTIPDAQEFWKYGNVNLDTKPTGAEKKNLEELKAIMDDEETDDADAEAASSEYDAIQALINQRAITPEIKKRAGVFVSVSRDGGSLDLEYRTLPKAEKPAAIAEKKKEKAAKAALPEDNLSQGLLVRMADQLTAATQSAIVSQPHVAMAALIAAIASRDSVVGIHPTSRHDWQKKLPSFASELKAALQLSSAKQIEVLTAHVAKALSLTNRSGKTPALENENYKSMTDAIDGKRLTSAVRGTFDAKDYFASVSRAMIIDAVGEAMGGEHASNVAKMDKPAAVKFAIANLPKTKWLPKQLRVVGYDGPAKKKATVKKAATKAKR